MPRRKQTWRPATESKVVKLPPNGPKPGQPVSEWMRNKDILWTRELDALRCEPPWVRARRARQGK